MQKRCIILKKRENRDGDNLQRFVLVDKGSNSKQTAKGIRKV